MSMRSVKSITGVGSTAWIPVNTDNPDFKLGFGVVVGGTVNYTVEHTYDDIYNVATAPPAATAAPTPVAFPHPVVVAQTANKDGAYGIGANPANVAAIRLTINSGTGTATITALQGRP